MFMYIMFTDSHKYIYYLTDKIITFILLSLGSTNLILYYLYGLELLIDMNIIQNEVHPFMLALWSIFVLFETIALILLLFKLFPATKLNNIITRVNEAYVIKQLTKKGFEVDVTLHQYSIRNKDTNEITELSDLIELYRFNKEN